MSKRNNKAIRQKPKRKRKYNPWTFKKATLLTTRAETLLRSAPDKPLFDLVITSPPYNIGKKYEKTKTIGEYLREQRVVIEEIVQRLKPNGSICWQVGNYVAEGEIFPLDFEYHKIFRKLGLKLRNRIVWRFGHGLHHNRRFSGRYEVILWYTKGDDYPFNLDAVRIPSKYPAKRYYKGPKKGEHSSHPLGKNPEDVWEVSDDVADDVWNIPNVNGNHVEKTAHPCQFPIGLAERLILALTDENAVVFDPYAGVASAGAAAVVHGRRFLGCEQKPEYTKLGRQRLKEAQAGTLRFRPHNRPIYDHKSSPLSIPPVRNNKPDCYSGD